MVTILCYGLVAIAIRSYNVWDKTAAQQIIQEKLPEFQEEKLESSG